MDVRQVDTSELHRVAALLQPEPGVMVTGAEFEARKREFARSYPPVLGKVRRQARLQPVAVKGSPARGRRDGYFMTRLRDGSTGYLQRRVDDCLQAAIATLLQVPPYLVPDLHLDDQVAAGLDVEEIERATSDKLVRWMDQRAVTIMIHPVPPTTARRWIGIAPTTGEPFSDHCLIMSKTTCLFDPSVVLPLNKDEPGFLADPSDIAYGLTIEERKGAPCHSDSNRGRAWAARRASGPATFRLPSREGRRP